jgi:hypothetical protein
MKRQVRFAYKEVIMTNSTYPTLSTNAGWLRNKFEQYSNVTLRKLATHCDVKYFKVLNARKKPIEGVAYDPEAVNWEAVTLAFGEESSVWKLTEENWEELNVEANRNVAGSGTVVKEMSAFSVGQSVYLRREATTPYTIIHITGTHVVIQLEGTETPLAWKHETFLFNGPSLTPRDPNAPKGARVAGSRKERAPKKETSDYVWATHQDALNEAMTNNILTDEEYKDAYAALQVAGERHEADEILDTYGIAAPSA